MADAPAPRTGPAEGTSGEGPAAVPAEAAVDRGDWSRLTEEERAVLLKVAEILQRIQFGNVVLVVQDGKVVQIEMAEKFRLR